MDFSENMVPPKSDGDTPIYLGCSLYFQTNPDRNFALTVARMSASYIPTSFTSSTITAWLILAKWQQLNAVMFSRRMRTVSTGRTDFPRYSQQFLAYSKDCYQGTYICRNPQKDREQNPTENRGEILTYLLTHSLIIYIYTHMFLCFSGVAKKLSTNDPSD